MSNWAQKLLIFIRDEGVLTMTRFKRLALLLVLLCSVAYLGGCPNPAAPPASPAELPALAAVPDTSARTTIVVAAAPVTAFGDLQALALASFFPEEPVVMSESSSQESLIVAGGGILKEAIFPSCTQDSDCKTLGFYRNSPLCQGGECLMKCSENAHCAFLGDGATCSDEGVCKPPEESSICTADSTTGLAAACSSGSAKVLYCANQLKTVSKTINGHEISDCFQRDMHLVMQLTDCKRNSLDGLTAVTLNGNYTAAQVDGPTCYSKAEVSASFPATCTKNTDCNSGVEAKCFCSLSTGETVEFESGECSGSSGSCTRVIDLTQANKTYDVWAISGLGTDEGKTSPNLTFTSAASSTSQGTVMISLTNEGNIVDDEIKLLKLTSEIKAIDTNADGTATVRTAICNTTSKARISNSDCTCTGDSC